MKSNRGSTGLVLQGEPVAKRHGDVASALGAEGHSRLREQANDVSCSPGPMTIRREGTLVPPGQDKTGSPKAAGHRHRDRVEAQKA